MEFLVYSSSAPFKQKSEACYAATYGPVSLLDFSKNVFETLVYEGLSVQMFLKVLIDA